MKSIIYISILLLILIGCKETTTNKNSSEQKMQKELLLQKNKELELKEKELDLRNQELELLREELNDKPKKLDEIYNEVRNSVYLIYTKTEKGISQGSAFVISPQGLAISNYHVFENASDAIAYNETNNEFLITEVLEYSKEDDYIIFRIGPIENKLPYLDIASFTPSIGEECFAIGNPKGLRQTISKGIISSYRDKDKTIQTTTQITHGSSGGPLFNFNGEVIGITTRGLDQADLNFAINILDLPIKSYLSKDMNVLTENNLTRKKAELLVKKYYSILNNDNFDKLSHMYSNTINRFYDNYNIEKNDAISLAKSYKPNHKIISTTNKIRWETFKIKNIDNISVIQFTMDYEIFREDKSKPSIFVLSIVIEVNSNEKIQSIYENILARA